LKDQHCGHARNKKRRNPESKIGHVHVLATFPFSGSHMHIGQSQREKGMTFAVQGTANSCLSQIKIS
jgi:hypothetical protein